MYSLSLSFIFLVNVIVNSNIQYRKAIDLRYHGAKLVCHVIDNTDTNSTADLYKSLEDFTSGKGNYSDVSPNESIHQYIDDFALRPWSVRFGYHGMTTYFTQAHVENIGRCFHEQVVLYPVVPNFEAVAAHQFVKEGKKYPSSLSGSELLFTAMGSQRAMVGSSSRFALKLKTLDDRFLLKLTDSDHDASDNVYKEFKPLGWWILYPHYYLSNWLMWESDVLIPASSLPRQFDGIESIEDIWMWRMWIKLKPNVVRSEIDLIKDRLSPFCKKVWDYNKFSIRMQDSVAMLDFIFSMNTYMALFLCLFSLIASMSTNIIEQTKEIGILRSLGITKFELNKIYLYEALVLILSSSLIGILVGSVLCFVVLQQQQLFSTYPTEFYVPQSLIGACVTGAIGTSVLSVWFPLKNLNAKQIAQNLRDIS